MGLVKYKFKKVKKQKDTIKMCSWAFNKNMKAKKVLLTLTYIILTFFFSF